jgi:hypothetical protein
MPKTSCIVLAFLHDLAKSTHGSCEIWSIDAQMEQLDGYDLKILYELQCD